MKTVKDIMVSYPRCCRKNDTLQSVIKEMSLSNIGSLPVIDENKKVIGIITDRDICLMLGKMDKPASELHVEKAMTHRAHTCSASDDASLALKIMRLKKIGRLPVVDSEGKIKGIITLNGIVRELYGKRDGTMEEYEGKDFVADTLFSISKRNHNHFEYEHWEE